MDTEKIKKWIRVIAIWSLFTAIVSAIFYILIYFKIIEEDLQFRDHIDLLLGTVAGLIIFVGLWKATSWGWKFTIIVTGLYWIYSTVELFIDYERFIGVATAPFIILDALILRFLFRSDVREFFNISSHVLVRLNWLPIVLFLFSAFLVVTDLLDSIVGIVTVIGIYFGLRISKKARKESTT